MLLVLLFFTIQFSYPVQDIHVQTERHVWRPQIVSIVNVFLVTKVQSARVSVLFHLL